MTMITTIAIVAAVAAGLLALPSARDFPKYLDVKTGRTMVILPPSTGKVIVKMGASQ